MKSCSFREPAQRYAEPLPALTTTVETLAAKVASLLAKMGLKA